eukprot:UN34443
MLNHQPYASYTKFFMDYKARTVNLYTIVDYPAGEQIWIHAGNNMNALLVAKHGFYIPNNPHDYVSLTLEYSRAQPNGAFKINIVKELLNFQQIKLTIEGPDQNTLRALQILFLEPEHLDSYTISKILTDQPI